MQPNTQRSSTWAKKQSEHQFRRVLMFIHYQIISWERCNSAQAEGAQKHRTLLYPGLESRIIKGLTSSKLKVKQRMAH